MVAAIIQPKKHYPTSVTIKGTPRKRQTSEERERAGGALWRVERGRRLAAGVKGERSGVRDECDRGRGGARRGLHGGAVRARSCARDGGGWLTGVESREVFSKRASDGANGEREAGW